MPRDVKGDPDLLNLTQPARRGRAPRRLLRGGSRHHDHEHVHRDVDRTGRLRPRGARPRDEPGGCSSRAQSGRRLDGPHAGAAAVRRRRDRTAQRLALRLAEGRRSRLPAGDLRRGARDLRGADRGARGGRCRPAPRRDDLRHAEREGSDRRPPPTSLRSFRSGSRSRRSTEAAATSPARPRRRSGSRSSTRGR